MEVLKEDGDEILFWTALYSQMYPIMVTCGFPTIPPRHMFRFMPVDAWALVLAFTYASVALYMVDEHQPFEDNPLLHTMWPSINSSFTSVVGAATSTETIPVLMDLLDIRQPMSGGGKRKTITEDDLFDLAFGQRSRQSGGKKTMRKRKQRGGMFPPRSQSGSTNGNRNNNANGEAPSSSSAIISSSSAAAALPPSSSSRAAQSSAAAAAPSLPLMVTVGRPGQQVTLPLPASGQALTAQQRQQTILAMAQNPEAVMSALTAYSGAEMAYEDFENARETERFDEIKERLTKILASLQRDYDILLDEIAKLETKTSLKDAQANLLENINAAIKAKENAAKSGAAKAPTGITRRGRQAGNNEELPNGRALVVRQTGALALPAAAAAAAAATVENSIPAVLKRNLARANENALSEYGLKLRRLALEATKKSPAVLAIRELQKKRKTVEQVRKDIYCAACRGCCIVAGAGAGVGAALKFRDLKDMAASAITSLRAPPPPPATGVEGAASSLWDGVKGAAYKLRGGVMTVAGDMISFTVSGLKDAATTVVASTVGGCCGGGETLAACAEVAGPVICCAATTACIYKGGTYSHQKYLEYKKLVADIENANKRDDEYMLRIYIYSLQAASKLYFDQINESIKIMQQLMSKPDFRYLSNPSLRNMAMLDFIDRRTKVLRLFEEASATDTLPKLVRAVDDKLINEELTLLRNLEKMMKGPGVFAILAQEDKNYLKENFDEIFRDEANMRRQLDEFKTALYADQEYMKDRMTGALSSGLNFAKVAATKSIGAMGSIINVGVTAARAYGGDPTAMATLTTQFTGAGAAVQGASNAANAAANTPNPNPGQEMTLAAYRPQAMQEAAHLMPSAAAAAAMGASNVQLPPSLGQQMMAQQQIQQQASAALPATAALPALMNRSGAAAASAMVPFTGGPPQENEEVSLLRQLDALRRRRGAASASAAAAAPLQLGNVNRTSQAGKNK